MNKIKKFLGTDGACIIAFALGILIGIIESYIKEGCILFC